jgi:hypothetical protein
MKKDSYSFFRGKRGRRKGVNREQIELGIVCFTVFNPVTPELNPSSQRCIPRYFTGDFASWTVPFVTICVKNQQTQQLIIQFY